MNRLIIVVCLLLTVAQDGLAQSSALREAKKACETALNNVTRGTASTSKDRFRREHSNWASAVPSFTNYHFDLVVGVRDEMRLPRLTGVAEQRLRDEIGIALYNAKAQEYRDLLKLMGREMKPPRSGPRDRWISDETETDGSPMLVFNRVNQAWQLSIFGTADTAVQTNNSKDADIKLTAQIFKEIEISDTEVKLADGRKFSGSWLDAPGQRKEKWVETGVVGEYAGSEIRHLIGDRWKWTSPNAAGKTIMLKETARTQKYIGFEVVEDKAGLFPDVAYVVLYDDHIETFDQNQNQIWKWGGPVIKDYFKGKWAK